MSMTVRLGDQFPDAVHNGETLPLGSIIRPVYADRGDGFERQAPNTWVNIHNRSVVAAGHQLSRHLLLDGAAGATEVTIPPESVERLRWRLRDAALAAAERSGIGFPAVLSMAATFDAPEPMLTVGGVVSNGYDLDHLPVGTVVYGGHPSEPRWMNVWTKGENYLEHTFGPSPARTAGEPVTIFSLPVEPTPEPPPADGLALAKAAMRAWRVGRTYQRRYRWCSVFQDTLDSLGITDKGLMRLTGESPHGVGDILDREQVGLLPEGTLLWWRWRRGGGLAVYLRTDEARNKSRTRRVFGFDDNGEQSHDRMEVLQTPDEEMVWTLPGHQLLRLPDGVWFCRPGDSEVLILGSDTRIQVATYLFYSIKRWVS